MNTTLHQNRPEDTQNWTNLYLEPHDYRIHYVNIDLRHQYGISVAKSQTFLRGKTDVFVGYCPPDFEKRVPILQLQLLVSIGIKLAV